MKPYIKWIIILLIVIGLLLTACLIYSASSRAKAKRLCQDYFANLEAKTLEPFCYGYVRLDGEEFFLWNSEKHGRVYGTRNMQTGEERIYTQDICYFYADKNSEAVPIKPDLSYEEISKRLVNELDLFSKEIAAVSMDSSGASVFGEDGLPIFWQEDSQILELELAEPSEHFSPEADAWAQIAQYSDGSSIFSYQFNPIAENLSVKECMFFLTAQQTPPITSSSPWPYGWQGHTLPEWENGIY